MRGLKITVHLSLVMAISILLNGSRRELPAALTVAELLTELQLTGKRVAVECNGEIVPRSRHGSQTVQADDQIEIVHAIGGG